MKINNKLKYGASALVLALSLSACSGENADQAKETAQDTAKNAETTVNDTVDSTKDKMDELKTGLEEKEFEISLDDAMDKFKEAFDAEDIEISSIELDEDNGEYAYEINGFSADNEYSAKIDAETGDVISKEEEKENDTDDADEKIAIDFDKLMKPKAAMDKALENNEGYVKSYEIDHNDEGKLVYEIDVEDGDDVELDAETGDIIHK
ncbi:PepSY domain-containing protein [uncultured Anaerococcus sp.]|uniref:PepSY domain-containing protein n=1 Tax=uncultured Anaerococcus sp. TaxID=293428 RepID=UPI0026325C37|nr:PepSY domain-containing protein [uncultured Anaerococcus sp.]